MERPQGFGMMLQESANKKEEKSRMVEGEGRVGYKKLLMIGGAGFPAGEEEGRFYRIDEMRRVKRKTESVLKVAEYRRE